MSQKIRQEKMSKELYQAFVPKCFNTHNLYNLCTTDALKALLSKNRFYFYFLIV